MILASALAALAGRGAKTPVDARAAAEYVAKLCERNCLRESPSSEVALSCVDADVVAVVERGAKPLTSGELAIKATSDEHTREVFIVEFY